ncbi:MAG: hypothetical protein HY332_22765 [Chloroflexi bacterium]|nr:hypothetical protein [Chloroflexota bacterium]
MPGQPDVKRYAQELQSMLRRRDPAAYRAFIRKWRDLHQRGAAERLLAMSDEALRLRIEHMILDMPTLSDLHESAREYLREHEKRDEARRTKDEGQDEDRRPGSRPGGAFPREA